MSVDAEFWSEAEKTTTAELHEVIDLRWEGRLQSSLWRWRIEGQGCLNAANTHLSLIKFTMLHQVCAGGLHR